MGGAGDGPVRTPDEAKAEMQRPQGGIAELLEIEAKASAIDVDTSP